MHERKSLGGYRHGVFWKTLSLFFLTLFSFESSADTGTSQYSISINAKNIALAQVFETIKLETGLTVFYSSRILDDQEIVSISFNRASLDQVMDYLLEPRGLRYEIKNSQVILIQKQLGAPKEQLERQQIQVIGRVTDTQGVPVAGVSVTEQGTRNTSFTDTSGNYSIPVTSANVSLEFTHMSYETQVIGVKGRSTVNLQLYERITGLDEVVVVGYGEVNREDLTGSVGQVQMADIEKAPVMSFDQALAGRIAGVQVSSNDGQPGSGGINITIRGAGSLTQSTGPLFVVDDFPIEDFDASSLSMSDIESISVLKDASATAIYGARGANGVIVIETKKGKIGRPEITYDGSFGFQEVTKKIDMMNPFEFVKYQLERSAYSEATQNIYTPADLPKDSEFYDPQGHSLDDYRSMPGINWQDLIFRNGNTSIHDLSLRGGSKNTRYSLSGSIFKQKGVVLNSGSDRVTGRIAIDQTVNDKLKTGIVVNYSDLPTYGKIVSESSTHAYNYLMYTTWGYRPVSGLEGPSGIDESLINDPIDPESEEDNYLINPLMTVENELRTRKKTNLTANGYVNYDINRYLTLRTTAAYMAYEDENTGFYNSLTNRGTPRNPNNRGVQGNVAIANINMWKSSTFLTYSQRFDQLHNMKVMLGADFYESASKRYGFDSQYIPEESLGLSGMDDGLPSSNRVTLSKSRMNSYFTRVNYDYRSKYLLTATFRADGSSKFKPGNRWGYFPSAAIAWRMSNEPFMKNIAFITDAKLRISYGLTGNNRVSDFAYLATITGSNIADGYSYNNGSPSVGYYPGSPGNDGLRWESTKQFDIGYDLALFDNRLELIVDLYRKNTVDLLLNANTPTHTGFSRSYKNIGELQNDGLELTLHTTNIKSEVFNWSSSFNISFNKNRIVSLTSDESSIYSQIVWDAIHNGSFLYSARVGNQAAMFMGYLFDGIYQIDDFSWQSDSDPDIPHESREYALKSNVPDNGSASGAVRPGDIKYKDINGDGTINEYDETIIGDPMPLHSGGFSNNFTYKNFDLNVFFQWSYGNEVFNANRIYFEGGRPVSSRNQFATYVDRWSPDNPSNVHFRAGGQGPLGRYSSKNIEDASYLRLKTISLAYHFPEDMIKRLKLRRLSVNATAQNLITWTNYSGLDPEVSVRNSVLTPGFDWSAYPRARTIVFGIKAVF